MLGPLAHAPFAYVVGRQRIAARREKILKRTLDA
jgi:hypothetical protein